MEGSMEKKIKDIMDKIECDNNFMCYYSGIENFDKVKCDFYNTICEAITKDANSCIFCTNIGYRNFCNCPLLRYLIEKRNDNFLNKIER
jgi:hypothetical protein